VERIGDGGYYRLCEGNGILDLGSKAVAVAGARAALHMPHGKHK